MVKIKLHITLPKTTYHHAYNLHFTKSVKKHKTENDLQIMHCLALALGQWVHDIGTSLCQGQDEGLPRQDWEY